MTWQYFGNKQLILHVNNVYLIVTKGPLAKYLSLVTDSLKHKKSKLGTKLSPLKSSKIIREVFRGREALFR